MLKVLVCGGRDFNDFELMVQELDNIIGDDPVIIISGRARGADTLAVRYANSHGDEVLEFPADWEKHGKKAGILRNIEMLNEGKPDIVVAFPGGRGTAHMVSIAKKAGVEVIEIQE